MNGPEAIKRFLLAGIAVLGAWFVIVWTRAALRARRTGDSIWPGPYPILVGALTDFFDALGIGSFATTTALFHARRSVLPEALPGTLNVGHTLPALAAAAVFLTVVEIDPRTLICMIAAAVAGAWLGAGVVARWPRRTVQVAMGLALAVAALLTAARQIGFLPPGGQSIAFSPALLAVGVAGNFVFGALMTLGVGLYAPCMILVSGLGMSPLAAFPIMMGSCAFLQPVAAVRFIHLGRYDLRASLGLTAGGVPSMLVAALVVKSLPLEAVRWTIVGVVLFTATAMLRDRTHRTATGSPGLI